MAVISPEFLVLGHVTKDVVEGGFRLGGTATYASLAALRLGLRVGVITSVSSDLDISSTFRGIEVHCIDSPVTTTFENVYLRHGRDQFVRAVASRLTVEDIPDHCLASPVVLLGPVAQELDPNLVYAFPKALIGVTPQGWMRKWDEQGKVYPKSWEEASTILPHATVLILSREDIGYQEEVIAGYAASMPVVAVTEGSGGAKVHFGGEWHHVPAFQAVEVDPTGAGDAFAAAYLIHYAKRGDPLGAALFANCVASLAIEQEGVAGLPTLEQVRKRMLTIGQGTSSEP